MANRFGLKFETICDGTSGLEESLDKVIINLTVTKRETNEIKTNPALVINKDNFELITTNLNEGTYIYSVRAYSKGSEAAGYVEMVFDYNVGKSIYMIFISVLFYLIFGLIAVDAIVHNKYQLFRYFIYACQFIHFTGL